MPSAVWSRLPIFNCPNTNSPKPLIGIGPRSLRQRRKRFSSAALLRPASQFSVISWIGSSVKLKENQPNREESRSVSAGVELLETNGQHRAAWQAKKTTSRLHKLSV